jgi:hypothetical protein
MKTLVITLLFVCLTNASYSQKSMAVDSENENIKTALVPDTNHTASDVYLPDEHPDAAVRELQKQFENHSIPKNHKEGSLNKISMKIERGTIEAQYDENQRLIRVNETYKRVKLPAVVVSSVQKEYPGWQITHDTYFYAQENGVVTKKEYNLKIENENRKRNIVVYADGQIKQ